MSVNQMFSKVIRSPGMAPQDITNQLNRLNAKLSPRYTKQTSSKKFTPTDILDFSPIKPNPDIHEDKDEEDYEAIINVYNQPLPKNSILDTDGLSNTSTEIFLPPQSLRNQGKKTLVIDLDETLIHTVFQRNATFDYSVNVEIQGQVSTIYVHQRPFAQEFIARLSNFFEIVFFTASMQDYAEPLFRKLDLDMVGSAYLYRDQCTVNQNQPGVYIKDLSKLGRNLKDVIIVDNSPQAYQLQNENALPTISWFDDYSDTELNDMMGLLIKIAGVDDVRFYLRQFIENGEIDFLKADEILSLQNSNSRFTASPPPLSNTDKQFLSTAKFNSSPQVEKPAIQQSSRNQIQLSLKTFSKETIDSRTVLTTKSSFKHNSRNCSKTPRACISPNIPKKRVSLTPRHLRTLSGGSQTTKHKRHPTQTSNQVKISKVQMGNDRPVTSLKQLGAQNSVKLLINQLSTRVTSNQKHPKLQTTRHTPSPFAQGSEEQTPRMSFQGKQAYAALISQMRK